MRNASLMLTNWMGKWISGTSPLLGTTARSSVSPSYKFGHRKDSSASSQDRIRSRQIKQFVSCSSSLQTRDEFKEVRGWGPDRNRTGDDSHWGVVAATS